jgi:hypothetical protein
MMVYVFASSMAAVCRPLDDPWLECPRGARAARRSWALINTSGFSFFWADRRPAVRVVLCRRVVCGIERLGLRRRGSCQS